METASSSNFFSISASSSSATSSSRLPCLSHPSVLPLCLILLVVLRYHYFFTFEICLFLPISGILHFLSILYRLYNHYGPTAPMPIS
jgi:hypothetical protein